MPASDPSPAGFVEEARRILGLLEAGILDGDARRVARVADDTLPLIRSLEKMPGSFSTPPSAGWCDRARDVIDGLWSLRAALIESADRTRAKRCDPLLGAAAKAIRALETAGWSLPRERGAAAGDTDLLDRLRAAIARHGHDAKPDIIIGAARVAEKAGRAGLRTLEAAGEYTGFARSRPKRYRK